MVKLQPQFILISFPAQGHINPALQLVKRLTGMGAQVTFITTEQALSRMSNVPSFNGLSISSFSEGFRADDFKEGKFDPLTYMLAIKRCGAEFLNDYIVSRQKDGHHITCVIYTVLFPWAADVAHALHVPAVLLLVQPAAVLDIYYYYFNGFADTIKNAATGSSTSSLIDLPGLPRLTTNDVPSFLQLSNRLEFPFRSFQHHIEVLDQKSIKTKILVNTFDELEGDALRAVDTFGMVAIGPLIPSAFLDGKDPADKSLGADFCKASSDCIEWLDSKPESSVVYVSFGTLTLLSNKQMDELARGLLDSGYPFLWVIRENENRVAWKEDEDVKLSCRQELERKGKIVTWSPQLEVLSHPSLGCFLTHCGWNSILESLVAGVPMVAFPKWGDQPTNAKLLQDLWKVGVRLSVNGEGIAESKEIARCLDQVMGDSEEGNQLRMNAKKWRGMAVEAGKEGGSSDKNLRAFLEYVVEDGPPRTTTIKN